MKTLGSDQELLKNVFFNLEKVRLFLGLSHKQWAMVQNLTLTEYEKLYLRASEKYPFKNLLRTSAALDILPESLFEKNSLDLVALHKQLLGDHSYIPEKYSYGAYSKCVTMKKMIEFVEKQFGIYESAYILKSLQIKPYALEKLDQKININFASDLLGLVERRNAPASFFSLMGAESIGRTLPSQFAKELQESRTIPELYESYLEDKVKNLEINSVYKCIYFNDESFIVRASQNDEVIQALKNKFYGSSHICEFKTGGLKSISTYGNFQGVTTKKMSCIHLGDTVCTWLISYNKKLPKLPSLRFVS